MGSQYLRISSAPATIAAPTATIGRNRTERCHNGTTGDSKDGTQHASSSDNGVNPHNYRPRHKTNTADDTNQSQSATGDDADGFR